MAYARYSASNQPTPTPNSTRPLLISSTSATDIGNRPGWRNVAEVTGVPKGPAEEAHRRQGLLVAQTTRAAYSTAQTW